MEPEPGCRHQKSGILNLSALPHPSLLPLSFPFGFCKKREKPRRPGFLPPIPMGTVDQLPVMLSPRAVPSGLLAILQPQSTSATQCQGKRALHAPPISIPHPSPSDGTGENPCSPSRWEPPENLDLWAEPSPQASLVLEEGTASRMGSQALLSHSDSPAWVACPGAFRFERRPLGASWSRP